MFTFFNSLANIFSVIVDFIIDSITTLVKFFLTVLFCFESLFQYIGMLPQFIILPLSMIFLFVLALQILNKGS